MRYGNFEVRSNLIQIRIGLQVGNFVTIMVQNPLGTHIQIDESETFKNLYEK
jgi:hypothetical protein